MASALAATEFDYSNYHSSVTPTPDPINQNVFDYSKFSIDISNLRSNINDMKADLHIRISNDMSNLRRIIDDAKADLNNRLSNDIASLRRKIDDVKDNLNNRRSNDMPNLRRKINDVKADSNNHLTSQSVIEGNEYKLSLPISGYEKEDITVKTREGVISIEAYHQNPGGSYNFFSNNLILPDTVNPSCTWSYDNSVLKIVCPWKDGATTA